MSERLDGKKQLEEALNRSIKNWSQDPLQDEYDHVDSDFGPFVAHDGSSVDFATYLEMQSMQYQIDELTQKLAKANDVILNLNKIITAACNSSNTSHFQAIEYQSQRDMLAEALQRLLNAHQPKPFGGIIDPSELQKAVANQTTEIIDSTRQARQALGVVKE
jgi:hypothetical protein